MSLSDTIVETITTTELQDVSKELAEIAVDGIFQEAILRDIPILGTVVGLGKGVMSISDRLFTKKLLLFIFEIKDLTSEERNKQITKIQRDSKYENSIGEKLLMIIDKSNDSKKASWIGRLFYHCLKNEIDYRDFIRCSEIINNASLYSLQDVIENTYTGIPIDQEDDMISSGLFKLEPPKIELLKSENTHQHMKEGEDLRTTYHVKEIEWSAILTYHGSLIREYLKNY